MMIKAKICDRCGKQISEDVNEKNNSSYIKFWLPGTTHVASKAETIDLCIECTAAFEKFITEKCIYYPND